MITKFRSLHRPQPEMFIEIAFEKGLQLLVFLRRGYGSVGFIGIKDQPASVDRLAGLQRSLAEIGRAMLPHHQVLIRHERERSLGLEAFGAQTVHAWMAQGQPPRAVLTYTDTVAYGVLRACREVGLRVPEDLALVGFDDEAPSRYLDPPLARSCKSGPIAW